MEGIKSMATLTQSEYLNSPDTCPFCHGTNSEATGESNTDADWHSEEIQCNDCGKEWNDIYTLAQFQEITEMSPPWTVQTGLGRKP